MGAEYMGKYEQIKRIKEYLIVKKLELYKPLNAN